MLGMFRRKWIFVPLVLCGCHSWSVVPLAPGIARQLPAQSWVVRIDGERVALKGGRVTADSVVATRREGGRFTLSRDAVAYVEERHVSWGRTIGGVVGLMLAWVLVSAASHMDEPERCPYCGQIYY
jgi:hypothetical protein